MSIFRICAARGLMAGALFAATAWSTALCAAEPPGGASANDIDRAKAMLRAGNSAFRDGDFAAAREAYAQAYALRPSYDTAGSLGEALLKLARYAEAAKYLEECVRLLPTTVPAALRDRMRSAYQEARAQVGALRITVNVQGAEILVDGRPVGVSPLERDVFVDPGDRMVTAQSRGESLSQAVIVAKASSATVPFKFETGPSIPLLVAGGAAGALGVASGVVFAILSNGKAGDATDLKTELESGGGSGACLQSGNASQCDQLAALREDQALLANVSAWSFIGSGVALAATGVYALVADRGELARAPSSGSRVLPVVVARGGGLMIEGRW